ncbi:MAG: molybdopterin-dependent oxidoreductase [Planctomycetaceae bacterium]
MRGRGGMGNVTFGGVRLKSLLEQNGIDLKNDVRWLNASGTDEPLPGKQPFLHSLPIDDVLNRSLLALTMNGEPLPAIHGGPVRLMTPGVYGTMHIKWLNHLHFASDETDNENHVPRYRVPRQRIEPGAPYEYTRENSSFNWNMKIKSVLLTPTDGQSLKAGSTVVQGVAFNDGLTRITAVYLSFNHGESWKQAMLTPSESLYGWTRFQLAQNFSTGRHPIWCRAVDAYGRTQPLNGSVAWNTSGYEWNGIEQISVDVA